MGLIDTLIKYDYLEPLNMIVWLREKGWRVERERRHDKEIEGAVSELPQYRHQAGGAVHPSLHAERPVEHPFELLIVHPHRRLLREGLLLNAGKKEMLPSYGSADLKDSAKSSSAKSSSLMTPTRIG